MRFISALFFALCFLTSGAHAADSNYRQFDRFQETISKKDVDFRLTTYLQKDPQIEDHYTVTDEGISLFASKADKDAGRAEYCLRFGCKAKPVDADDYTPAGNPDAPLQGLRVAIDPAHHGGPFARSVEKRFVDMRPGSEVNGRTDLQFNEGTLTILTAKYLKAKLEAKGATVLMTRTKVGEFAYALSFDAWLRDKTAFEEAIDAKVASVSDPQKRAAAKAWWMNDADKPTLFRLVYNTLEMRARAEKINAFRPHVTLMIHYNADNFAGNDTTTGQNIGSNENYNMAFVGGSFMKGELADQRSRQEFLRLLVTEDLRKSLRLTGEFVSALVANTGVPLIDQAKTQPKYIGRACLPTGVPGVFTRNLGLSRLAHGALCYGEALYQDNFAESQRLVKKDLEIDGIKGPARIKNVGDAYLSAILRVYGTDAAPSGAGSSK